MAKSKSFDVGKNMNYMFNQTPTNENNLPEKTKSDIIKNKTENTESAKESKVEKTKKAEFSSTSKEDKITNDVSTNSKNTTLNENISVKLNKKKKETRSVHKNFLFTESLDEKFSKMALELEMSQNDLINEILSQVLT